MTISFSPLTEERLDHLGMVLRGSWGATCWCMHPRLTDRDMRELPGAGAVNQRRRAAMAGLTTRWRARWLNCCGPTP